MSPDPAERAWSDLLRDASPAARTGTTSAPADPHASAARLLLVDHLSRALTRRRGPDAPAHLVVVAGGQAADAVVFAASLSPHCAEPSPLRTTVLADDVQTFVDALRRRHEGGGQGPMRGCVRSAKIGAAQLGTELARAEAEEPVSAVVVAVEDPKAAVAAARAVLAPCSRAGVPLFVRLDEGHLQAVGPWGEGGAWREADVRAFAADAAADAALDSLASAVHERYVEADRARAAAAGSNPSAVPWSALPETLRESNRRQADHLPWKLAAVGRWAAHAAGASPAPFGDAEVERLAALEHARWVAERLQAGWTFAPGPKDAAKRTSPHLVPYERLADAVRELDRDTVRAIPELLATRGLVVVRASP